MKLNFWELKGNLEIRKSTNSIIFRDSSDYGDHNVKISTNWWVWKINEPQVYIGQLIKNEHRSAEIGMVFNPIAIIERMKREAITLLNIPVIK